MYKRLKFKLNSIYNLGLYQYWDYMLSKKKLWEEMVGEITEEEFEKIWKKLLKERKIINTKDEVYYMVKEFIYKYYEYENIELYIDDDFIKQKTI